MNIVDRGIVFESAADTEHSSLAFPAVCVMPGGRWLVSCRAAPTKLETRGQHVLLSYSDNGGESWSTACAPFVAPTIDGRPGLFRMAGLTPLGGDQVLATLCWVDHSNPEAAFFNEQTQGLLDTRIFLSHSNNRGETWSVPQLLDTTPFQVPTPITGPTLVLQNGEWACQFELNKPYFDLSEWHHASIFLISGDKGRTWREHSVASQDPENRIFYWDQRPNVLPGGRMLNLFWTYDNQAAEYLSIHASDSKDNGRTWSPLWDTKVPGQPAPPVGFSGGRIAMVYVDREAAPTLKLRVSEDGGHSWPLLSEQVLFRLEQVTQTERKSSMQDAWSEMGKFSLGLPATASLPGNELLVVFYAGPETDRTSIHWLRARV